MNPAIECGTCLTGWIYGRARSAVVEGDRLRLLEAVINAMAAGLTPDANLGEVSNQATDAAFLVAPAARSAYSRAKTDSNRIAAETIPRARTFVAGAGTVRARILRAASVAALANVAPLGVPSGPMAFEDVRSFLEDEQPAPEVLGDLGAVENARKVVYVADNAGEVGFDAILMGLLREQGAHVTLVVKEPDFFEDATSEEVRFFALDAIADEVLTVDGFLVPGKAPQFVSDALGAADLLVAKGTGSFEALYGEVGAKPALFLLKVKCAAISRLLGVPVGRYAMAFSAGDGR